MPLPLKILLMTTGKLQIIAIMTINSNYLVAPPHTFFGGGLLLRAHYDEY